MSGGVERIQNNWEECLTLLANQCLVSSAESVHSAGIWALVRCCAS
jgi:hypothetical protein